MADQAEGEVSRQPDPWPREVVAAAERERVLLGQELHDGLSQHLAGVALLARTLSNRLAAAHRVEAEDAQELAQLINSAVEQTRTLTRGLSYVDLEGGGLIEALQNLASQCRIPCRIEIQGEPQPARSIARQLHRIAREAVLTAVHHSRARQIAIRLSQTAESLTLSIQSDGTTEPSESRDVEDIGPRMMRYRAELIGGELHFGRGVTQVVVAIV